MVNVLNGLDYVLLFFRICIFFLGFIFVLTPMITICFLALFLSTSSSFFARPPRPLRHTKASLAPFPPRGPPLRQMQAPLLLHLFNIIPHHSPEVVIRHIHPTDQWLDGQWRGQWLHLGRAMRNMLVERRFLIREAIHRQHCFSHEAKPDRAFQSIRGAVEKGIVLLLFQLLLAD